MYSSTWRLSNSTALFVYATNHIILRRNELEMCSIFKFIFKAILLVQGTIIPQNITCDLSKDLVWLLW